MASLSLSLLHDRFHLLTFQWVRLLGKAQEQSQGKNGSDSTLLNTLVMGKGIPLPCSTFPNLVISGPWLGDRNPGHANTAPVVGLWHGLKWGGNLGKKGGIGLLPLVLVVDGAARGFLPCACACLTLGGCSLLPSSFIGAHISSPRLPGASSHSEECFCGS